MRKTYLTKDEKQLMLRCTGLQLTRDHAGMDQARLDLAAHKLKELDLMYYETDLRGVKYVALTPFGKSYKKLNPKLRNPFPWDVIMKAMTIIAAVAATLALFVGCLRLMEM